jgi:hypothetical protein
LQTETYFKTAMLKQLHKDTFYSYQQPKFDLNEQHGFDTMMDIFGPKYHYSGVLPGAFDALKQTKEVYTKDEILKLVSHETKSINIAHLLLPDGQYRLPESSLPGREREWGKFSTEKRKCTYTEKQFRKLIAYEDKSFETFAETEKVMKTQTGGKILLECGEEGDKIVISVSEELQQRKILAREDTVDEPHCTLVVVCGDLKKTKVWQQVVRDVCDRSTVSIKNGNGKKYLDTFDGQHRHYTISLSTLMSIHRGPIVKDHCGSKRKYNSDVGFSKIDTFIETMREMSKKWFVVLDGTDIFRNNISHTKPRGGKNYMSLTDFIGKLDSHSMLQYLICKSDQHVKTHDFDVFPTVCLLNPSLKSFLNSWKTSNKSTRNVAYHVVHQQKQSIASVVINGKKPKIQYRLHSFSTDTEEEEYQNWLRKLTKINAEKVGPTHSRQKLILQRYHSSNIRLHILRGLGGSIHPELYREEKFVESLSHEISGKIKEVIKFINMMKGDESVMVCGRGIESLKYVHALLTSAFPNRVDRHIYTSRETRPMNLTRNKITLVSRQYLEKRSDIQCRNVILLDVYTDKKREEHFLYHFDRKFAPIFTYMINMKHYAEKCVYQQWFRHLKKKL